MVNRGEEKKGMRLILRHNMTEENDNNIHIHVHVPVL